MKKLEKEKEEEKKREEERKLNKKKKKKHKNNNIDIYMIVLDEIIKAKNKTIEKKDKKKGINKYYYPKLKNHFTTEKKQKTVKYNFFDIIQETDKLRNNSGDNKNQIKN